jgi:hypothetical protein
VKQLIVQHDGAGDNDDVTLVLDRVSPRDTADVILSLQRLPFVSAVDEKGAARPTT